MLATCIWGLAGGWVLGQAIQQRGSFVIPDKMKFAEGNLYDEDEKILHGVFGTSGDDAITDLARLPSDQIVAVGKMGKPAEFDRSIPRFDVSGGGGTGFVAIFEPKMRQMEAIAFMPRDVPAVKRVQLAPDNGVIIAANLSKETENGIMLLKFAPGLQSVEWRRDMPGREIADIEVMKDGSILVLDSSHPRIHRVKADGSGLIPFGQSDSIRVDLGNPQVQQKYWVDLGYKAQGYSARKQTHCAVVESTDGNIVYIGNISTSASYGPDFEPIMLKFDREGNLLWATHLCETIPAESDHKDQIMTVDRKTGDILVGMIQHGHFTHNLKAPGGLISNQILNANWLTGDIMIGWIGRVDSQTGEVKYGTFFFPQRSKEMEGGKYWANSLFPRDIAVDDDGNIFVTGRAAGTLSTTGNAFLTRYLGGSFLAVFRPKLDDVIYVSYIGHEGIDVRLEALVLSPLGPVVAGSAKISKSPSAKDARVLATNIEATNYLKGNLLGGSDIQLTLLPSFFWFLR